MICVEEVGAFSLCVQYMYALLLIILLIYRNETRTHCRAGIQKHVFRSTLPVLQKHFGMFSVDAIFCNVY